MDSLFLVRLIHKAEYLGREESGDGLVGGGLFGGVPGEGAVDQHGEGVGGDVLRGSEQDGAAAYGALTVAGACQEGFDQVGAAMDVEGEAALIVGFRRQADAQAASGAGFEGEVGGLAPAQRFGEGADPGQVGGAGEDQRAQLHQPGARRFGEGVEGGLNVWRGWGAGRTHRAASGRCNSVIRSSGAVFIGLFL